MPCGAWADFLAFGANLSAQNMPKPCDNVSKMGNSIQIHPNQWWFVIMFIHSPIFQLREWYIRPSPLDKDAFTHRRFYTQNLLHTDFHTQTLLHTDAFTHKRFYTQTLLHTEALTRRSVYTQKFLHTEVFTHRSFYTQKFLHTEAFTHRTFYTQTKEP